MATHKVDLFTMANRRGVRDITPTKAEAEDIRRDVIESTSERIRHRDSEIARSRVVLEEGVVRSR